MCAAIYDIPPRGHLLAETIAAARAVDIDAYRRYCRRELKLRVAGDGDVPVVRTVWREGRRVI